MLDVLLVEDNPTDASLSSIAIALRLFGNPHPPRVAILGLQALKQAVGKLNGTPAVVIGFAPALSASERQRRPFCDALEMMLDAWLP